MLRNSEFDPFGNFEFEDFGHLLRTTLMKSPGIAEGIKLR